MIGAAEFDRLVRYLKRTDFVLSRTAKTGSVDTAASSLKKPSNMSQQELLGAIDANRLTVVRLVSRQAGHVPGTSAEILGVLLAIAVLTNDGIVSEGLFRKWNYQPHVKALAGPEVHPSDIPAELWNLADSLLNAAGRSPYNALEGIASVEWEIGIGALHPFYDGCGRISRYFTAMNSLWFKAPLKCHESRDQYMRHASEGKSAFVEYYKSLPSMTLSP